MKRRLRNLALLALLIPQLAFGMAAIEYLKLQHAHEQARILEPIIVSFVSRGYKNVPDWAPLAHAVRALILKNGYTYQNVENVAEEAAIGLGMTR